MPRNFTQTMTFHCDRPEFLIEMAQGWDLQQAKADIMGYTGSRLLQDREDPTRFVLVAEFGIVDPDVSAYEEAQRNNDRPETAHWIGRLREEITSDIQYHDYDEIYRTD